MVEEVLKKKMTNMRMDILTMKNLMLMRIARTTITRRIVGAGLRTPRTLQTTALDLQQVRKFGHTHNIDIIH